MKSRITRRDFIKDVAKKGAALTVASEASKRLAVGEIIQSAPEEIAESPDFIATDKLKESWSEIEAWNQELEKRVEDATVKLTLANKELQEINNRLQIADQKKTEVLVTVAHDIRGPLSAIKSCVGVVLGGYVVTIRKNRKICSKGRIREWKSC